MKAETAVAVNVTPKDELALKSLRDITCSTLQETKGVGFCLQFYFAPNKYFSNHILAKTYYLSGSDTEPILEHAEGGVEALSKEIASFLDPARLMQSLRLRKDGPFQLPQQESP